MESARLMKFNENISFLFPTEPELLKIWDRQAKGIPIGRPPEVGLRNNHAQYIFTWCGCSFILLIDFTPPPRWRPLNN